MKQTGMIEDDVDQQWLVAKVLQDWLTSKMSALEKKDQSKR